MTANTFTQDQGLPAVSTGQSPAFTAALDYTNRELLDALKRTVAKDTTDAEFRVFVELCKTTGLNPLQKQIWCFKGGGGQLITMAGIWGFHEVANSYPQYDGIETELDSETAPTMATCRVYRKDRSRPMVAIARMKEFRKSSPTWNAMPCHMLTKVAEAIALRKAFPQKLSGIYIPEEIEGEAVTKVSALKALESPKPVITVEVGETPKLRNEKLQKAIEALESVGVTHAEVLEYVGGQPELVETSHINELRDVYRAIRKGECKKEDIFKPKSEFTSDDEIPGEAIEA